MREGDILLTRGKNLISDIIGWGQTLLGKESAFVPSHTAIIADEKHIWEATAGGVRKTPLARYVDRKHTTYVASLDGLTEEQRKRILHWAKRFEGRRYGYMDLLVYFVDLLGARYFRLKRGWLTRRLNTQRFLVCSEFVGYVYGRAIHYRFRDEKGRWIRPSELTPLDIWRHVKETPEWRMTRIS